MSKLLSACWYFIAIIIFVYSYGFVDLNLTLSSHPLVFNFVSFMQQLSYFDRLLSLKVFITLIIALFGLYLATISLKISAFPWRLVIVLAVIFALAYPMLSSDVFKYLFSAKAIILYHVNPYLVTPDTFADDTWIRFMRWVHTTTPYGPIFTLLTIPYYVLGMGKFVPILYLFKLDQIAWYLLTIWLIGRITALQKWSLRSTVLAQLFFAVNPLIIMEWLVNAHNDAIMLSLLMLAIYLSLLQKRGWSFLTALLSAGIKYVTIIFLPVLLFPKLLSKYWTSCLIALLTALSLIPLLYHYSWQYQPWYVTWLIPLASLIDHKLVRATVVAYSFAVFSRYLFFVGTGSWLGTPTQHALMTFVPPVLTASIMLINSLTSFASAQQRKSPQK